MPMPCGQDVYASKLFVCRSNSTVVVVVNELITIPSARKHMSFDGGGFQLRTEEERTPLPKTRVIKFGTNL
ncbi:hypothetical protein ACE6H2_003541 [Prunus campanulata]